MRRSGRPIANTKAMRVAADSPPAGRGTGSRQGQQLEPDQAEARRPSPGPSCRQCRRGGPGQALGTRPAMSSARSSCATVCARAHRLPLVPPCRRRGAKGDQCAQGVSLDSSSAHHLNGRQVASVDMFTSCREVPVGSACQPAAALARHRDRAARARACRPAHRGASFFFAAIHRPRTRRRRRTRGPAARRRPAGRCTAASAVLSTPTAGRPLAHPRPRFKSRYADRDFERWVLLPRLAKGAAAAKAAAKAAKAAAAAASAAAASAATAAARGGCGCCCGGCRCAAAGAAAAAVLRRLSGRSRLVSAAAGVASPLWLAGALRARARGEQRSASRLERWAARPWSSR